MGIFTRFKKPQDDAPKEIELPVLCGRIAKAFASVMPR